MIPSRAELVEAYDFYARRHNLEAKAMRSLHPIPLPLVANQRAIDAALSNAAELVGSGTSEVAACIYVFARFPKCFPMSLFGFAVVIAMNVARTNGLRLSTSAQDLKVMMQRVLYEHATVSEVEDWVIERIFATDGD